MTPELRDLPADLRDAVRLYLIDGYTMEEAGLLMGASTATFRDRLKAAAVELNPGVAIPRREKHRKQLLHGRQR